MSDECKNKQKARNILRLMKNLGQQRNEKFNSGKCQHRVRPKQKQNQFRGFGGSILNEKFYHQENGDDGAGGGNGG